MDFRLQNKIITVMLVTVIIFLTVRILAGWFDALAAANPAPGLSGIVWIEPDRNLNFVFGLKVAPIFIYFVTFLVLGILIFAYLRQKRRYGQFFSVGYGFIFGGAVSNLYERIRSGFVRDYVHVKFFSLEGVYNPADFFIILGMILVGYEIFFNSVKFKAQSVKRKKGLMNLGV